MHRLAAFALAIVFGNAACSSDSIEEAQWQVVQQELDGALMSVWGTSSTDVWAVGADPDDGKGPMVLHYDGTTWTRKATGVSGDLWWVFGFADGPVYMGGEGGQIVRYAGDQFEVMTTPGTNTVFGIWGASPDDIWAVGGGAGGASGAFAWHLVGDTWTEAEGFPTELAVDQAVWKVFGRAADDVWMVGTNGLALRYDGAAFEQVDSGTPRSLFTVHGNAERFIAVGGYGTGTVVENDGSGWVDVTPAGMGQVTGVYVSEGEEAYAVGVDGAVYRRSVDGWAPEVTDLAVYEQLHGVWVDEEGGVWAAGGQTLSEPLIRGVLMHKGPSEIPGGTYVDE